MHLPRGGRHINALQTFSQYVLVKCNESAPFHNPHHMGLLFQIETQAEGSGVESLSSPLPPVDDYPVWVSALDLFTRECF